MTKNDSEKPIVLSIIIVSFNTQKLTCQTIEYAIRDLLRSPSLIEAHEIIVVDNNSSDNSVPSIKRLFDRYPQINSQIITNNKNLGFAKANNQAIDVSKGEFVFLLNSDTMIQAGALEKLTSSMSSLQPNLASSHSATMNNPFDRIGILAATLLNWDGTHQPQGGDYPNLLSLLSQQFLIDDIPLVGKLIPSIQKTGKNEQSLDLNLPESEQELIGKGWVGGTAMMIRRELIGEIGKLDENIFMYGEDVEFCLRAVNRHWDIVQHPTARVTHFQNASSSSSNAIMGEIKGYVYIWSKHKPAWQYRLARVILIVGCLLRMIVFSRSKEKLETYRQAYKYLLAT